MLDDLLKLKNRLGLIRADSCKGDICLQLTVNIPGNNKLVYPAQQLFDEGQTLLSDYLNKKTISHDLLWLKEGPPFLVAIYKIDYPADKLKILLLKKELTSRLGPYLDYDVYNKDGKKLYRKDFDFHARKCIICDNPAYLCAFKQKHNAKDLIQKIEEGFMAFIQNKRSVGVNRRCSRREETTGAWK